MTINLHKGETISLGKEAPDLTRIMCGLGWDISQQSGGGLFGFLGMNKTFDLDASVLCLNSKNRITNRDDLVYFGNLRHKSGAISHLGDNRTGKGEGDDERIIVDLAKLPEQIAKLIFTVNINNAMENQQHFGHIDNAFVRLVDVAKSFEIARYQLSGKAYQGKTALIMAEVYRDNQDWKMKAIGKGMKLNSLEDILIYYC